MECILQGFRVGSIFEFYTENLQEFPKTEWLSSWVNVLQHLENLGVVNSKSDFSHDDFQIALVDFIVSISVEELEEILEFLELSF
jgi:hypothetical protein